MQSPVFAFTLRTVATPAVLLTLGTVHGILQTLNAVLKLPVALVVTALAHGPKTVISTKSPVSILFYVVWEMCAMYVPNLALKLGRPMSWSCWIQMLSLAKTDKTARMALAASQGVV